VAVQLVQIRVRVPAQVQALAAERLDLLLTDVAMPAGGGLALADRLRAVRPDLPVVFVTGYAEHIGVAAEVLRKPFTPRELGQQILRALGRLPGA
jgi:CheY-like chemotaxis protein